MFTKHPAHLPRLEPWSHRPGLRSVTFAGLDLASSLPEVAKLSQMFPTIEWGWLCALKADPDLGLLSVEQVTALKEHWPQDARCSLHLMGPVAQAWVNQERQVCALVQGFDRVQLDLEVNLDNCSELEHSFRQHPEQAFITTHSIPEPKSAERLGALNNHAFLLDASHQRKHVFQSGPCVMEGKACGYRICSESDRFIEQFQAIEKKIKGHPYWVEICLESEKHAALKSWSLIEQIMCEISSVDSG